MCRSYQESLLFGHGLWYTGSILALSHIRSADLAPFSLHLQPLAKFVYGIEMWFLLQHCPLLVYITEMKNVCGGRMHSRRERIFQSMAAQWILRVPPAVTINTMFVIKLSGKA